MFDMRRREFITLLGGAAAWPLAARAQQAERMRRVGVLTAMSETDPTLPSRMAAFQKGLQAFGWAEGRECEHCLPACDRRLGPVEIRGIGAGRRGPGADRGLEQSGSDGNARGRPVDARRIRVGRRSGRQRVRRKLGRPGGNLTGFTAFEPEMGGKWLEHLKEVAPALTRAMVLLNPNIAANFGFYRAAQAAGTALRINVDAVHVRGAADIQRAVSALAGEHHAGVLVLPNPVSASHREQIASLSAAHRVPSVAGFSYYVESGVLIGYGPEQNDLWRRSASYVDRILRGDPPASLPVQTPVKFELAINLKTAKALGLTVPDTLLARADEVIEAPIDISRKDAHA